jgi:hypothetical protein
VDQQYAAAPALEEEISLLDHAIALWVSRSGSLAAVLDRA